MDETDSMTDEASDQHEVAKLLAEGLGRDDRSEPGDSSVEGLGDACDSEKKSVGRPAAHAWEIGRSLSDSTGAGEAVASDRVDSIDASVTDLETEFCSAVAECVAGGVAGREGASTESERREGEGEGAKSDSPQPRTESSVMGAMNE